MHMDIHMGRVGISQDGGKWYKEGKSRDGGVTVPFHKAARGAGLCIGWSEQCGAARGGGGGNPARVASMEGGPGKPPDRAWMEWIVKGIQSGFRVGHDQGRVVLKEKRGMMYEGSQHREIIGKYLREEVGAGRVHRVKEGRAKVQCSPFGVIPKKGKPGRWRLIVNLSAPDSEFVSARWCQCK